jgi:23S rRNA (uracil1939-C5)-methyltransferase
LKIDRIGGQGDGIGDHDGQSVFVTFTLPEEVVEVDITGGGKHGLNGKLIDVIEASKKRVEPECPHFTKCGGCNTQHLSQDLYEAWRHSTVTDALKTIGISEDKIEKPYITPPASRRRVSLGARKTAKGVVLGFREAASHKIIDIEGCGVARPELVHLFPALREALNDLLGQGQEARIQMTIVANGIDILIEADFPLDLDNRYRLMDLAEEWDVASLHWDNGEFLDPVSIRREPSMNMDGVKVPFPPGGFIQASDEGQAYLIKRVKEGVAGAGKVADLFSGIGTFSLPIAKHSKVLAAEENDSALNALKAGYGQNRGLQQIITRKRNLFKTPISADELSKFDAVVFDPPRAGAKTQVHEIAKSGVPTVIAVSCNINTFMRDAQILLGSGYEVATIAPVDQFLWSQHLEIFAKFVLRRCG